MSNVHDCCAHSVCLVSPARELSTRYYTRVLVISVGTVLMCFAIDKTHERAQAAIRHNAKVVFDGQLSDSIRRIRSARLAKQPASSVSLSSSARDWARAPLLEFMSSGVSNHSAASQSHHGHHGGSSASFSKSTRQAGAWPQPSCTQQPTHGLYDNAALAGCSWRIVPSTHVQYDGRLALIEIGQPVPQ